MPVKEDTMKILFIGGTGTISMAITRLLAERGDELYLLNRGNRNGGLPENVKIISCDINDEKAAAEKLAGMEFDCVGEFIGFVPAQLERDFRLFAGKTKQFIYISSASAYRKPMQGYTITEETPLENPYWEYSRNKKACEEYLFERYRKDGFPVTVVRPSHTYDERSVPLGVHGANGSWQVVKRIMSGKPVIIHGDGTSLWTITHNSDFAKAYIGLIGNPAAIGEAFHITTDESVSWNEIDGYIADALGTALKPFYVSSETLAALGKKCDGTDVIISLTDPGWCRTDLGGQHAPNAPESSLPGVVVGAFVDDKISGRNFAAGYFHGMTLEQAVEYAEKNIPKYTGSIGN